MRRLRPLSRYLSSKARRQAQKAAKTQKGGTGWKSVSDKAADKPPTNKAPKTNASTAKKAAPDHSGPKSSAPPSTRSEGSTSTPQSASAASNAASATAAAAKPGTESIPSSTSAASAGSSDGPADGGGAGQTSQRTSRGFGRILVGGVIAVPLSLLAGIYGSEDIRDFCWKLSPQMMELMSQYAPGLTKVGDNSVDTAAKGVPETVSDNSEEKDDFELKRDAELHTDLEEGEEQAHIEIAKSSAAPQTVETPSKEEILPQKQDETMAQTTPPEPTQEVSQVTSEKPPGPSMLEKERDALEKRRLEDLKNCKLELDKKWTQELERQEKSIRQSFRKEREDRMSRMQEIETQAEKLERILQWHSEHQKLGHHVHQLTGAVLLLEQVLNTASPLGAPWERVAKLADGDSVVAAAISAVPSEAVERGVATVKQLQKRFETVVNAGRRGALVPPGAGIGGHLLAGTISALLVEQRSLVKGKDELSRLTRASYFVSREDLFNAVRELEQLDPKGLPAKLCRDWLKDAKGRLVTDMAIQILKSHAADLASSIQL